MELEITDLPIGVKQLALRGRLDIQGTNAIDNKFAFAVTTSKTPVLVDLSAVDFVASIGIRLLLQNAKALKNRGGKLALYGPQPLVAEALTTAGIDLLIPVFDDLDAAGTALLEAPPA